METEQRCTVDTCFSDHGFVWSLVENTPNKNKAFIYQPSARLFYSAVSIERTHPTNQLISNFRKGQFVSPSTSFETLFAVILSFTSNFSNSIANAHKAISNWYNWQFEQAETQPLQNACCAMVDPARWYVLFFPIKKVCSGAVTITETFSVFSSWISNVIDTITKTESSFDPKISGVTKYLLSSKRENNIRYLRCPFIAWCSQVESWL